MQTALPDRDMSPELADLLRAGATNGAGIVCRPSQVEKLYPLLRDAERRGYLRFIGVERPWITDEGRAAIGEPSQSQVDRARLLELCSRRRRLEPAKKDDPRTDFDYRSYRALGYVCTLVIRQADSRPDPQTMRVGRSLKGEPQFLGPRNSIVLPESEGKFVLALMPHWLISRAGFSTYPLPLDESDGWTAGEVAVWDRLRQVCFSVNSRIRNAGRRRPERRLFGETA